MKKEEEIIGNRSAQYMVRASNKICPFVCFLTRKKCKYNVKLWVCRHQVFKQRISVWLKFQQHHHYMYSQTVLISSGTWIHVHFETLSLLRPLKHWATWHIRFYDLYTSTPTCILTPHVTLGKSFILGFTASRKIEVCWRCNTNTRCSNLRLTLFYLTDRPYQHEKPHF